MSGDDLAREFGYRGPRGRFDIDADVSVAEAIGWCWREREREAALLVGDAERVAWLDGLAPEAVCAHALAAKDARGPEAYFAGHAPPTWHYTYESVLREARRAADHARRLPVREPTAEDRANRQACRDQSRAILLGMPVAWVPPVFVRARRRVQLGDRWFEPGEVIELPSLPTATPVVTIFALLKSRWVEPVDDRPLAAAGVGPARSSRRGSVA